MTLSNEQKADLLDKVGQTLANWETDVSLMISLYMQHPETYSTGELQKLREMHSHVIELKGYNDVKLDMLRKTIEARKGN